jgi:hypothetical protein
MSLERTRWQAAYLLNRAEYGYGEHYFKKLLAWLPEDYRNGLVQAFNECDFKRVEDLIKYRWPMIAEFNRWNRHNALALDAEDSK